MNHVKKRGRPRSFDEADILSRITNLFWEKGYSGTSLDMVCAATGLTRPSLYAAFGSKRDMLLKCLDGYALTANSQTARAAETKAGKSGVARAILGAMLDLYSCAELPKKSGLGCFAITTLSAETENDADLKAAFEKILNSMDTQFAALLRPYCSSPAEAETLGKTLALLLHGCSARIRAGEEPQALKTELNLGLDQIFGP